MQGDSLVEGRTYAYRERRGVGQPFIKVKLLAKTGRKGAIKVRFEDGPHPGLEEYVHTRQLVVPWPARKALMRDEERMERLKDYLTKSVDPAIDEAASTVLASSGELSACTFGGLLSMPEDELERLMVRANLPGRPTDLHALAFKDRLGEVHVPLEGVVALARAFAAADAENVLMYIQDDLGAEDKSRRLLRALDGR
jgi:hypothetical protein